jgi:acyl carrier protein
VRGVLTRVGPSWTREVDLRDDLPLGEQGLGLDSVAIAELLIACERHFGVRCPASLLRSGPLTIARLASHMDAGRGQGVQS